MVLPANSSNSSGGATPQPDATVRRLEDTLVAPATEESILVSSMAKAAISGGARGKAKAVPTREGFPLRPAYGSSGTEVVLWANYFNLTTSDVPLYKYTIEAKKVPREGDAPAAPAPSPKSGAARGGAAGHQRRSRETPPR